MWCNCIGYRPHMLDVTEMYGSRAACGLLQQPGWGKLYGRLVRQGC